MLLSGWLMVRGEARAGVSFVGFISANEIQKRVFKHFYYLKGLSVNVVLPWLFTKKRTECSCARTVSRVGGAFP